ncbi:MAG TPA: MOSC domain-containing protein [Crinalium sp.]|jgi:alkylated DNA nucleotide flippase Atl1
MKVIKLFKKQGAHQGVHSCESLLLRRSYGIEGDANAAIGSPRQVLMAGLPSLTQFDLQPGQMQENMLIDCAVEAFISGQVLQIGSDALIRLMHLCEPCATLEKLQPGLAKRIKGKRGLLGMVVRDGWIKVGDHVTLTAHQFPLIPESTRGRFEEFVSRIPSGNVVRTSDLLLALGLTRGYYRSIPILLKKSAAQIPVHRVVASDGSLLLRHVPHQRDALLSEGVELVNDRVADRYYWQPIDFHDLGLF